MANQTRTRTTATALVLLVAAGSLVPAATALAPDLTANGVGSFLVDAEGHARGANVASGIAEASGALSGFSVTGLAGGASATTVFDSVGIAGFQQTRKIEGAGSAALTLVGSNAVLQAIDSSGGLLNIAASEATTVTYTLPADIRAGHADGLAGHVGSALMLRNAAGTELGTLVHVPAHAAASAAASGTVPFKVTGGEVQATIAAGDRVLFRGIAGHLHSFDAAAGISILSPEVRQHVATVADLGATGTLIADSVAEFEAGSVHDVTMSHRQGIRLASALAGQNAVRSTISGAASASADAAAVIQHELDYEVLPVQHASDVAVYVNGRLVPTATSAAQLAAKAEQGLGAAHALTMGGRTHVLTSVPAEALAHGTATVTLVDATAVAGAVPRAESQAVVAATSSAVGNFEALGNLDGIGARAAGTTEAQTKFIGRFASGVITKEVNGATVIDHTDLETRATIFDSVTVVGETLSGGERVADAVVRVSGPATTLTAHDDLYGTTILHVDQLPAGRASQEVAFDLAGGITARQVNDQVVRLEGPGGYVGWLVATSGSGSGSATGAASLALSGATQLGATDVAATLGDGATLLHLAQEARTGYASMEAIAHGIASGRIGGQALVGTSGQSVHHLSADYLGSAAADVEVTRAARGAIGLTHSAKGAASAATSVLVDARGTALMSGKAQDLGVLVDGEPALLMTEAESVLDAGFPAYFVDTSAAGTLLVLVNAADRAHRAGGAEIDIVSDRAVAARSDAATDVFGGFDLLSDGTALGHYVQAQTDLAAGTLRDVTVTAPQGATVVFDAVHAGSAAFGVPTATGTAGLVLTSSDSTVSIADQTSAVMRLGAKHAHDATFVLASGVRADAVADNVVMLYGPNGFLGVLVTADAAGRSIDGGSLRITGAASEATTVTAALESGGQVVFRAFSGIEAELDATERATLAQALGAGQVAGQVIVQAPSGAGAALSERARFATAYASGATSAAGSGLAVTHAATSFSSTMSVVAAATTNEVTVTLTSALEAGKTVLVSLDAGLIPGLASGNAEILFDGVPIDAASSYADVLHATDDAGIAEYYVITSSVSGASQVLVSVPHFSTHTVTIRSSDNGGGTDVFLWVSIGLALVVIGETAWFAYRRRTA